MWPVIILFPLLFTSSFFCKFLFLYRNKEWFSELDSCCVSLFPIICMPKPLWLLRHTVRRGNEARKCIILLRVLMNYTFVSFIHFHFLFIYSHSYLHGSTCCRNERKIAFVKHRFAVKLSPAALQSTVTKYLICSLILIFLLMCEFLPFKYTFCLSLPS